MTHELKERGVGQAGRFWYRCSCGVEVFSEGHFQQHLSEMERMGEQTEMQPNAEIAIPRCPHCGGELAAINKFNWGQPPVIVLAVFCPHDACRTLLHMSVLPVAVQQEPRSVVSPH